MNCSINQCNGLVKAKTFCAHHLRKQYKYGDPCFVKQYKKDKPNPCAVSECSKKAQARSLCLMHYRRWSLYGNPLFVVRDAGYRKANAYTMVIAHGHPNANELGKISEHRLVMSNIIGRPLEPGENVHHKNGDRKDNRPENLELWNTTQPAGQRPTDKVAYAVKILELYSPDLLAESETA